MRLLRHPLRADWTRRGTAGSSKPPCRIAVRMGASQLLRFVCFDSSRSIVWGGEGWGRGGAASRHLRLLQPVPRPFGGVRTSREVGRPAITLRRSGGGRRRPASS